MVKPSQVSTPSPDDFLALVRAVGTGSLSERLQAAATLGKTQFPIDEVPVLLGLIDDQDDRVQVAVIRAIGRALKSDRQEGVEAARQAAVAGLLGRIYRLEESAAKAAGELVGRFMQKDALLKDRCQRMLDGLASAGMSSYSVPTGNDIDALVLAAPRSREAREKLREAAKNAPDISKHTLVARLHHLADPETDGSIDEVKEVFRSLEGLNFGSVERNREVARAVRAVLDRFGVRLLCPKCPDDAPPEERTARLAFLARLGGTSGLFQFDHGRLTPGRFHSGTAGVPRLEVHLPPHGRRRP